MDQSAERILLRLGSAFLKQRTKEAAVSIHRRIATAGRLFGVGETASAYQVVFVVTLQARWVRFHQADAPRTGADQAGRDGIAVVLYNLDAGCSWLAETQASMTLHPTEPLC